MKRALHRTFCGLLLLSGFHVLPALAEEAPAPPGAPAPVEGASAPAEEAKLVSQEPPAAASFVQPAPLGLAASGDMEILRRELEDARQELLQLKSEVRAQLTTQSALQGWQEPWIEQKQKLKFFVMDGYFRTRPELFRQLNLGQNYTLFPTHKPGAPDKTFGGVNMRLRMEPTLNISEQVRVRLQADALDNLVFGSTPDYAFSRDAARWRRDEFGLLSNSQAAPSAGMNSLSNSLAIKRAWGEISMPLGAFYFGRMPSNWGLGMLRNDGSCLDCNLGDTVDRFILVAEPWAGYYFAPMFEMNIAGVLSSSNAGSGQPMGLSTRDSSYTLGAVLARKDTESQRRAKLNAGASFWNYGLHFTYRAQSHDAADYYGNPFSEDGTGNVGFVPRKGKLFVPDIWVRYERPRFRLEFEVAAVLGSFNRATTFAAANALGQNQSLNVVQFGAVLQGEYTFYRGDLRLQAEVGFASGDKAPGFGNYPSQTIDVNNTARSADGPQYACQASGCTDNSIRNFRFNRDYIVDMILFREILGGVTDALYLKPTVKYRIVDGFDVFSSLIYSRAIYRQSTPSESNSGLGVELNLGARYETEEGFFAQLAWGILFPLSGFEDRNNDGIQKAKTANALRGALGIRF
jgi:uncharacterized protein (TIGR04551 family)